MPGPCKLSPPSEQANYSHGPRDGTQPTRRSARRPNEPPWNTRISPSCPCFCSQEHAELYPYSHPRTRSYLQDILVLLSEQETPDSPRIFVTAIEANVYNVPTTSSAILYISKVDSTGQGRSPSPTSTLVKSFISYYANPATRPIEATHFWIQLFARAQNQYIFPNSSDFAGKKPLSDVKLCAWWKRVYTDVATELVSHLPEKTILKMYYLIPGYSQLEADHSLKIASSTSASSEAQSWIYGHPYSQTDIPLPCPSCNGSDISVNIGTFIPSFDDDPKSRFLDEMAVTDKEVVRSPPRKRARTVSSSGDAGSKDDWRPPGELGRVTPEEFWERMSFRQECVSGAVTGFFTMIISAATEQKKSDSASSSSVSPLAPRPGQVSSNINKRVTTSLMTTVEFSTVERAIHATESIERSIKGLCEGIASVPQAVVQPPRSRSSKPDRAPSPTFLEPPKTPPRRNKELALPDISPNPFPEPEATLETYNSYIYGSICVSNASTGSTNPREVKEIAPAPQVTVLTVRKKKKQAQ